MVLQSQIKSSSWCVVDIIVVVSVQDNYTFAQPGIQNNVKALEELVSRIDGEIWSPHVVTVSEVRSYLLIHTKIDLESPIIFRWPQGQFSSLCVFSTHCVTASFSLTEDIHNYFKRYEVEYLQFAFRWMNNLLMRELPLRCTIRLWDTYQVTHKHIDICIEPLCLVLNVCVIYRAGVYVFFTCWPVVCPCRLNKRASPTSTSTSVLLSWSSGAKRSSPWSIFRYH